MPTVNENNDVVQIQIPQNAQVGDEFLQTLSNGVTVGVTVPPGAKGGDLVNIAISLQNAEGGTEDGNALTTMNNANKLPFCTAFTITRVVSAFCLAICLGVVATVLSLFTIALILLIAAELPVSILYPSHTEEEIYRV